MYFGLALRGAPLIRGDALIRGRRLFQCRYPKVQRLLGGGAYWGPALIKGNTVITKYRKKFFLTTVKLFSKLYSSEIFNMIVPVVLQLS